MFVGLVTCSILSGCAHDHMESTSKTSSKSNNEDAIITQPTNQAVILGSTASFSVTANGTQPLSYQWHFNGTNSSLLTMTNVQGATFLVVTNE